MSGLLDDSWDKMFRQASIFVGLEATDGLLTMWAMNHGFKEVNLLIAPIADSWLLPVLKVALALLGVGILFPVAKRFPRMVNFGFISVSIFLIIVLASNFIEMFDRYFG